MNEPPASRSEPWQRRVQRVRVFVRKSLPFASGVLAALVALVFYNAVMPKPHQITTSEVNDTIAHVLASATAPPAYSALVYQVIQPSLVLIQSQSPGTNGKVEDGLGSGVIVDDAGDILTSLHVVANASSIQLTFADGTKSAGQVMAKQPENDIAVLRAAQPPATIVPATLGNPNAMHVGDEAYVVGNPFGLYSSMTAGVVSGFGRSFQVPNSTLKLHNLIQIDTAVNPGNRYRHGAAQPDRPGFLHRYRLRHADQYCGRRGRVAAGLSDAEGRANVSIPHVIKEMACESEFESRPWEADGTCTV